jgi:hypothetical protein
MEFMNTENCLFLMIIELLIDTFLISYSTWSRVSVVFFLTYCDIMSHCVPKENVKKSSCLYQIGHCICMWMTWNSFSSPIIYRYIYWCIDLSLSFPDFIMLLTSPLRYYQLLGVLTSPHLCVAIEHIHLTMLIEWEGCVLHTFPK